MHTYNLSPLHRKGASPGDRSVLVHPNPQGYLFFEPFAYHQGWQLQVTEMNILLVKINKKREVLVVHRKFPTTTWRVAKQKTSIQPIYISFIDDKKLCPEESPITNSTKIYKNFPIIETRNQKLKWKGQDCYKNA